MTRKSLWAGLIVVIGLALWVLRPQAPAAGPDKPPPVEWEYKIVMKAMAELSPRVDEQDFNKLGTDGWELCATVGPQGAPKVAVATFVFKRAKR